MKLNKMKWIMGVLPLLLLGSCSEWTELESVDSEVKRPNEQDPVLWARYMAALQEYKKSEHFIVYARFENGSDPAMNEGNFMRCLPDSLDIVALTQPDKFSDFDREDLAVVHEKGTKVLFDIDYKARAGEFADVAALNAYLDKAVAAVAAEGLDGYAFTTVPLNTEMTAAIVAKLAAAKTDGQLLVFEGSPLSIAEADRAKLDYIVLDTETDEHMQDVQLKVLHATGFAQIPAERLLLGAVAGKSLYDPDRVEYSAIDGMTYCTIAFGPVGGLAVFDIGADYYHAGRNYDTVCRAILKLNPSR